MSGFLTDPQRKDYDDLGYLFPVNVMSETEADTYYRRLLAVESAHGPMHYHVKPYLFVRSACEIATHPLLLDAVESILGPDVLLWDGAYIVKEPCSEGFVSWHQDLTYWGLEMDSDDDLLTAWVALTPATTENGCMQFVDGSHRKGTFAHKDTHDEKNILHRGQSIQDDFEQNRITQLELSPGRASFHHGLTVHASNPNRSDERRVALSLQYAKPAVRQVVGNEESATLVRGTDDYGHFLPEPFCETDFAPDNVAFQLEAERRKRDVYDTA